MTSIDFGVVAAPCCGTRYLAPQGVFMNLEGWKEWSDGYGAGDRYATPKSVCECACGSLFLVSEARRVETEPREGIHFFGLDSEQPPVAPYLSNARAGALVEADMPFANPALERDVRLFHWWALNHALRDWRDKRSRDWHEQGCWTDLQDAERDRLIEENARRLLPILETVHPSETLLLGEVHRILGHAERATEYFSRTKFSYPAARERLIKLMQIGDTHVAQIAPLGRSGNPLKMPEPRPNPHPRGQIVPIESRRYFFNPEGDSGRGRWAIVDPDEAIVGETLYFISDDSEIREVVQGDDLLLSHYDLAVLGYKRWERLRDLWEDHAPPGGPFFIVKK